MELLSTVHWVVTQEAKSENISKDELISLVVHNWNPRKSKMKPAHIDAALNRLNQAFKKSTSNFLTKSLLIV
jgi:hypothetical protein